MKNKIIISSIIMLIIGSMAGYFIGNIGGKHQNISKEASEDKKPLFYRNPMNPEVTSPTPAKDNMGMDYIPVYSDDDSNLDEPSGTVKINSTVVQNIGVRTTKAYKGSLSRIIRAVGKIDFDEEGITRIHSKTEGWIEELFIDKTGEMVKEDTMLLNIYSPKLVSTQEEYILALDNYKSLKNSNIKDIKEGAQQLLQSTKDRLVLLDVPSHQIKELEQTRKIKKNLHIHSPAAGTVINIGARKGQYVNPGTELYMIADLSKVWVEADIYEYEISWVKKGDKAEMTLKGIPGRTFIGEVDYIYPYAESKTRTIRVRLIFDNPDLLLRPEMFADVNINVQKQNDLIIIPSEAVVRSGTRDQVFVVRDKGKFEPRIVTLGLESDGKVAVLKGVSEGEEVVTSSQFLIDSESKLKEATAKMMESSKEEDEESDFANQKDEEWDD
jgi:Cu(I)/Ag(I) efflux system membrane fusion protein